MEGDDMSPVAGLLVWFLLLIVIGLGGTALWIWMIVDCATNEGQEGNDKLVWVLVIVMTGFIGALIYLLARRPKRIQQYGH